MLGKILLTAVNAVAPIVLLIALGYLLKRTGLLNKPFLEVGNKLVFRIFLPAMLFLNIYSIPSLGQIRWDLVGYCLIVITVVFLAGWLVGRSATKDLTRRGVIWQCTFRSNFAIIGLPLATSLGGEAGAAVAAVLSAFTIPMYNVYSVIALSVYTGQKKSPASVAKSIITNPLTYSVAIGLLALLVRFLQVELFGRVVFSLERDLKFLYKTLDNLKALASPLALIVLGGESEFSAVRGMLKEISVSVISRVVAVPMIAVSGALVLDAFGYMPCGKGELAGVIALFGSPVAVSSAIMAGNMKNDLQLATQLVIWTSVASVVTIFGTVCILMAAGFL